MKEIRIHGRGGQGAVTAARMLASAFLAEGKYVASFPMYGFERRGAPVQAFTRLDDKPVREKTQVYFPDCMVVIDPTLLKIKTLYSGLKTGGILIVNSSKFDSQADKNIAVAGVIDATKIAVEEIGRDIPNTCLLGAFAAATNWVKIESIMAILGDYLSGDMLQRNKRSVERGYKEVKVLKWH
ncbi:MAG TPA: 2-oxoacid:acceptor oxidoreductase family protein [Dehalococcoidales bacterium]|nr:2-oxoacid:acceptor oxidoreductase family protein [Dehalococcoidales bacterium]